MDLLIAVGGGGQHIALAVARLLRLGALANPVETFVIDADSDSRLATKLKTFGNTVGPGAAHPLRGAESVVPPFARDTMADTRFRRAFLDESSDPLERELFELFYDELSGGSDGSLPGVDIAKGMYGNPSVGSAVFAADSDGAMAPLFAKAQTASRIFVVGSFLGGTGAGITHQLVKLIRRAIEQKPIELYGIFLLRWFDLPPRKGDTVDNATLLASMGHGLEYFFRHTRSQLDASMLLGVPDHKPPALVRAAQAHPDNDEMTSLFPLLAAYGLVMLPQRTDTQARTAHSVYGLGYDESDPLWPLGAEWNERNAPSQDATLGARMVEATLLQEAYASFRQREAHFIGGDYPEASRTWTPVLAAAARRAHEPGAVFARKVLDALEARGAQLRFATSWVAGIYGSALDLGGFGDPNARDRMNRIKQRKWSHPDAFEMLAKSFQLASTAETTTPAAMAEAIEQALLAAMRR